MLNHITITVSDFQKSVGFYTETLATLGIKRLFTIENECVGFGIGRPMFWISAADETHPTSKNIHVAFSSSSRSFVDDWYSTAIAAGAKDNGKPGIREQYHPKYYAAFVLDPDGNNIEAVCGNEENR